MENYSETPIIIIHTLMSGSCIAPAIVNTFGGALLIEVTGMVVKATPGAARAPILARERGWGCPRPCS